MGAPEDPQDETEPGPTMAAPPPGAVAKPKAGPSIHDPNATPAFDPPAVVGEIGVLGPYRVLKELGRGGMGAVYLTFDTRLNRKLALKVMLPRFAAQPAAKERFLREARAAAQISHDNIVTVYEADERQGIPYIAMQLLTGASLEEYLLKKGELPVSQILRIARETASGLAAAHKIGLVHRDIKPANLWLEAPNGRVKVLDFGLAKPLDTNIELTTEGMIIGTPVFMSPEQARGQQVSFKSDLFSLGSVLYRLCSGQLPFNGPTTVALLVALTADEPTPIRELKPDVPAPLAQLIHQLLSKDPDLRPPSTADVVKRIRAIETSAPERHSAANAAIPASPEPMHVSVAEPTPSDLAFDANLLHAARRRNLLLAGGGIAAALALAIGLWIILPKNPTNRTAVTPPDELASRNPDPNRAPRPEDAPNSKSSLTNAVSANKSPIPASAPATQTSALTKNLLAGPNSPPTPPPQPTTKPTQLAMAVPQNNAPAVVTDADRSVAEWVLSHGGSFLITPNGREFKTSAEIPGEPFKIVEIRLANHRLADDDLARFADLKSLTNLVLDNTGISDRGLAHLEGLTRLRVLYLTGNPAITDDGLDHLKNMKGLLLLWLDRTSVSDVGMPRLANLKNLNNLGLRGTAVTAPGLAEIATLKELRVLYLQETKLTDAAIAQLKSLPNLVHLDLYNTPITDAGLAHLADIKTLAQVYVQKTKVTDGGLAAFHASLPNCTITHDHGTFLSIAEALTSPAYQWTATTDLGPAMKFGQAQADPFVTPDGLELYFATGIGNSRGIDIWFSRRTSLTAPWGNPVNAGPAINTSAWESMPLPTADGLSLVFWRDTPTYHTREAIRSARNSPWKPSEKIEGTDGGISPLLSLDGLELFISFGGKIHRLTRPTRTDPWTKPAPVAQINGPDWLEARWLSSDNRCLIGSTRVNNGPLSYWLAQRFNRSNPFNPRKKLDLPPMSPELRYPFFRSTPTGVDLYYTAPDNKIHLAQKLPKPKTGP